MKPRVYAMSNQFWDLVRAFFEAARAFHLIYQSYESKVLAYADERGVDRRLLRLSGEEVAGLLDFERLEQLVAFGLSSVRTISQNIFRSKTSTDAFDKYVSQIYHEVAILKEEQYKVGTIAPGYLGADSEAYQSIVDEVHEAFPRHVHAIHELLRKARARLEELLPHFRRDRVTLRSVYLFGDDVFDGFYPDGYEDALAIMFRGQGAARQGLLQVARSFESAGFHDQAVEALERAQRLPAPSGSPEEVALASSIQIEVDELLAKLKAVQRERKARPKAQA